MPFDNAPIATVVGNDSPVPGTDDVAADVAATSLSQLDLGATDATTGEPTNAFGSVTLGDLGLDTLGAAADLLFDVPLTELQIDGGWAQYLVGTRFEFTPLQYVTLGDVYGFAAVQSTPLRFTDIEESPLRFTDISAAAFGDQPVADIDLDGDGTATTQEWCDAADAQGLALTCGEIDADTTVGALAAAGFDVEATPLRFTPLRFTYVEASPLRFTPLRFTDIQGTPLRFTPLRFTDLSATSVTASPLRFTPLRFTPLRFTPLRFTPLRFTPLRFTPLRFTPLRFTDITATPLRFTEVSQLPVDTRDNVVDCSLTTFDCSATDATLEDAAAAGALREGFSFEDLGDVVLADLLLDDILSGLDEASQEALLDAFADVTIGELVDEAGTVALGDLTVGEIDPQAFEEIVELIGATIETLLASWPQDLLDDFTLGDFLLLFLPRGSYEWDEVELAALELQGAAITPGLDPASIEFTLENLGPASTVIVEVQLPDGAFVDPDVGRRRTQFGHG